MHAARAAAHLHALHRRQLAAVRSTGRPSESASRSPSQAFLHSLVHVQMEDVHALCSTDVDDVTCGVEAERARACEVLLRAQMIVA